MNKLEQFKAKAKSTGKSNNENVAVRISEYDLDNRLFVGTKVSDNTEVRVRLREMKSEGRYPRPEIEDFAADPRKSKTSTDIGGVIQFDGVYVDKDGVLNARWATVLSHTPDEGKVFVRKAKLVTGVSANGSDWAAIDVIYPDQVVKTTDIEEFKATLVNMLEPQAPVDSRTVAIRVKEDDTVAIFSAYTTKTEKNEDGFSVTSTGEESAQAFFETEEFEMIQQLMENGVTLVPGRRVFAGRATTDKLFSDQNTKKSNILRQQYEMGTSENEDIVYGYVDSNIVLRSHRDNSLYFTHIYPTVDNAQVNSLEDLVA